MGGRDKMAAEDLTETMIDYQATFVCSTTSSATARKRHRPGQIQQTRVHLETLTTTKETTKKACNQ